jgi:peptidoglycan/LPS O-acetylase OafA/YrhL
MIINIQFLRAIAALLVVFYHTAAHFFVVGGETSGNIFSLLSTIGYIGVDIFFVISGYIM